MDIDIQKIQNTAWYRQETEALPYFIYGVWWEVFKANQFVHNVIVSLKHNYYIGYFTESSLREPAIRCLQNEKEHPGYFNTLFSQWKEVVKNNEDIFQRILSHNLQTISDTELLSLQKKLVECQRAMWTVFLLDLFDLDSESLIEKELIEEGIVLSPEEKNILMTQEQLIVHQREERDLLRIVQMIKNTPDALHTIFFISAPRNLHKLQLFPEIQQALATHQKKYFWVHNSWAHTQMLTIYEFVERVKAVLNGPRDIEHDLRALEQYEMEIRRKKKEIVEKYQLSDWLQRLFHLFGVLSFWRDDRKAQMQQMNYYLELLGTEIARRSKLTWNDICMCDSLDVMNIPLSLDSVKKWQNRFSYGAVFWWNGKEIEFFDQQTGDQVMRVLEESMQKNTSEIHGMIACPGKAEGEVVVISTQHEFSKMKDGAVLIAPMTRPDYVPLMKRAAAIITDEGGITSHAAVVSRELKVPCIIGTQVATKKLKDGDKVFVNADHGVVIVRESA